MPQALYWITTDSVGRIGIAPRPRGGEWLEADLDAFRKAGVDVLVSLLTASEQWELNLRDEEQACLHCGLEYLSFPIGDRQTPRCETDSLALLQKLSDRLDAQQNILIHCRMGVGRAAMIAAAILVRRGQSAQEAFAQIEAARGCAVPDTPEQVAWVAKQPLLNLKKS